MVNKHVSNVFTEAVPQPSCKDFKMSLAYDYPEIAPTMASYNYNKLYDQFIENYN